MYLSREDSVLKGDFEIELDAIFERQNRYKQVAKKSTIEQRVGYLQQFSKNIIKRKIEIEQALSTDFNQAALGSNYFETYYLLRRIKKIIEVLDAFLKPKKVANDTSGSNLHTIVEPKGACLIITQWSFFVNLPMLQVCANVAVGNTVILKLSEGARNINRVVRTLLEESFPSDLVVVVEGDYRVTDKLLSFKYDHIQFNGSIQTAKTVKLASALHLSSVSMRLNTKCPAFIDKHTNISDAVDKIIWGKFFSAGPSYVAPDYVLVDKSYEKQFLKFFEERFKMALKEKSYLAPDFSHIINYEQFDRLYDLYSEAISKGASDLVPNQFDRSKLYISPTILQNVNSEMQIMQEGILGPILPVASYESLAEAMDFVNSLYSPEAIFVYTADLVYLEQIISNTNSRRVCVNEVFIQNINGFILNKDSNDIDLEDVEIWTKLEEFSSKRVVMFVHHIITKNEKISQKNIWDKIFKTFKS